MFLAVIYTTIAMCGVSGIALLALHALELRRSLKMKPVAINKTRQY